MERCGVIGCVESFHGDVLSERLVDSMWYFNSRARSPSDIAENDRFGEVSNHCG
jgi:hypothetical protein